MLWENKPAVDWSKPLQTIEGNRVRVIARDLRGPNPIVFAYQRGDGEEWVGTCSGTGDKGYALHGHQIVNGEGFQIVEVWLNVTFRGGRHQYSVKEKREEVEIQEAGDCCICVTFYAPTRMDAGPEIPAHITQLT